MTASWVWGPLSKLDMIVCSPGHQPKLWRRNGHQHANIPRPFQDRSTIILSEMDMGALTPRILARAVAGAAFRRDVACGWRLGD
ncbi:hypothetical protein DV708_16810 [Aeromonas veronii]|nr:hypothetical protein DV708_16810 [Aeromonas veronii]